MAYNGAPKLNTLPHCKKKYAGKNDAGGRKCKFTTPAAYNQGSKKIILVNLNEVFRDTRHWPSGITRLATPWHGWEFENDNDN